MIGISKYMCHVRTKRKKTKRTNSANVLSLRALHSPGWSWTYFVSSRWHQIPDAPASACQMLGRWECVSTPTDKTSLRQMFGWLRPSNMAKLLWEGARVQLYTWGSQEAPSTQITQCGSRDHGLGPRPEHFVIFKIKMEAGMVFSHHWKSGLRL